MPTAPAPTWTGLALQALPVLACAVVLAWRGLGQVGPLLVSVVRMALQLLLLGVVLGWIFGRPSPWISAAVVTLMLVVSAQTVGARHRTSDWPLRLLSLATMAVGLIIVMAIALRLALRIEPWYNPKVLIPLSGMVLGNSVNGVALAAERLDSELRAERDRIELRLALGASTRQAALPALQASVRAALTPVVNNMMIAGIVAIPGMTTGQLLAGADVAAAVRYQILVYLGITGTVAISTLLLLAARLRRYFTPAQQLRAERLAE